jgi:hypothetical protein
VRASSSAQALSPAAACRRFDAAVSRSRMIPSATLRVFVHAESSAHRPVFTTAVNARRGPPTAQLVPNPPRRCDVTKLFREILPGVHTTEEQIEVYLTRNGARCDASADGCFPLIREGDELLVRGGNRPTPPPIGPEPCRSVEISTKVLGLSSIDTVAQTFYCDFVVLASWRERCLCGIPEESVDWSIVWSPTITLENAFDPFEQVSFTQHLSNETEGRVTEATRFKGMLSDPLELDQFPFDTQGLCLKISTGGQHSGMVELKCAELSTSAQIARHNWLTSTVLMPDFETLGEESEALLTDRKLSTNSVCYPQVHVTIHVRRKPQFYMYSIVMILFGITTMAWVSFIIPRSDFVSRLETNLTLLLTAIAFKSMVDDHLPNIAHLTPLDRFILGHLGFIFSVSLENAVVALISMDGAHRPYVVPVPDNLIGAYLDNEWCFTRENCDRYASEQNELWVQAMGSTIETAFLCVMGSAWVLLHAAAGLWAFRRSRFVPAALTAKPQAVVIGTPRFMSKALRKQSSYEVHHGEKVEGGGERKMQ